jgi:hypothetical protein
MLHHETPINKRQISLTAGFVGYVEITLVHLSLLIYLIINQTIKEYHRGNDNRGN